MIAVKLEGRLGNQLFQYAFIYAAAKRLKTGFYLDKSVEEFFPTKYFTIKNDILFPLDNRIFCISGYKNIFNIHIKKAFYKMLEQMVFGKKKIIISNEQPISDALNKIVDGYMYQGYFQSEKYFVDCKEDIKAILTIKTRYIELFNEVNKNVPLLKKKVVIHIRRSDYVAQDTTLPLAYYKQALNMVADENAVYVFISDDSQFVKKQFEHIENKYISDNSEIIDLQFLINADVCILSNSSFSWWGAWLNSNKNKQVFAPKYWLGFKEQKEFPVGIANGLNFNWIQV